MWNTGGSRSGKAICGRERVQAEQRRHGHWTRSLPRPSPNGLSASLNAPQITGRHLIQLRRSDRPYYYRAAATVRSKWSSTTALRTWRRTGDGGDAGPASSHSLLGFDPGLGVRKEELLGDRCGDGAELEHQPDEQVVDRNDSCNVAFLKDWESPDTRDFEDLECFENIGRTLNGDGPFRHDRPDLRTQGLTGSDSSNRNVSISHYSQQVVAADHKKRSHPMAAHRTGRLLSSVHSGGTVTGAFRRHSLTNIGPTPYSRHWDENVSPRLAGTPFFPGPTIQPDPKSVANFEVNTFIRVSLARLG